MAYETPSVSYELLNSAFVDKVFNGQVKEAQEQASLYIRQKLYEDGIVRRLFEYRTVTADELDPLMDSDQPSIICELEPDATQATFVPFKGTGNRMYYNGKRFRVPFGKVEAERTTKSKFELMTIRMPIQQWLQENQIKAVQQEEDRHFLDTCEDIIDRATTLAASDSSAPVQYVEYTGSSFKDAFTEGMKALTKLRLPVGKVLMHKNTFIDSLKLKMDEISFNPLEERFRRGIEGEDSFLGVPVVTTIKDDLVPENVLYFFTTQDYFMKFFLLQDATLFLKTEADMVTFHTYEAPGIGIGNVRGVVKVVLGSSSDSSSSDSSSSESESTESSSSESESTEETTESNS